jgi:hypothetical protein
VVENGLACEPLANPDYTKLFVTRNAADPMALTRSFRLPSGSTMS